MEHDADGNGLLDRAEVARVLESLGLDVAPEQAGKIVERFDVDKNGALDLVELSSLVRGKGGSLELHLLPGDPTSTRIQFNSAPTRSHINSGAVQLTSHIHSYAAQI